MSHWGLSGENSKKFQNFELCFLHIPFAFTLKKKQHVELLRSSDQPFSYNKNLKVAKIKT